MWSVYACARMCVRCVCMLCVWRVYVCASAHGSARVCVCVGMRVRVGMSVRVCVLFCAFVCLASALACVPACGCVCESKCAQVMFACVRHLYFLFLFDANTLRAHMCVDTLLHAQSEKCFPTSLRICIAAKRFETHTHTHTHTHAGKL